MSTAGIMHVHYRRYVGGSVREGHEMAGLCSSRGRIRRE